MILTPMHRAWLIPLVTLLTLSVLYPTIYLHELGHAAAAFALGCKHDWSSVDMSPILFWSFGGDIDYACLRAGPGWAVAAVDGAGCVVNLTLLLAALSMGHLTRGRIAMSIWFYAAAAANYVEAFSYLVANTAIPRSDMIAVLDYTGIPNLAFAGFAAVVAIGVGLPLYISFAAAAGRVVPPARARRLVALASIVVAAGMIGARLPLTDSSQPTPKKIEGSKL